MNDLTNVFPLYIGGEEINATDSRELYKKLGLAKGQYKRWVEKYVNEYDFEENFDYIGVDMNVEGNIVKTYMISIDMAKEICMMTNNEIGSKIRKYYIALERKQCDTSKHQLETAHKEIAHLQVKRMKTYKEGFMSLGKYLKENNIIMTKETAFAMLSKYDIIEHRDVLTSKIFLLDDSFGRQTGDSVIEFNSRSLDLIFRDYVHIDTSLFD